MIRQLTDPAAVGDVCSIRMAVIYKHSPRCGTCVAAEQEVRRFAAAHPDVPVFQVDVLEHRATADALTRLLGVPHASPQVIVVRDGTAVWSATHWNVTAGALAEQVSRVGAA